MIGSLVPGSGKHGLIQYLQESMAAVGAPGSGNPVSSSRPSALMMRR